MIDLIHSHAEKCPNMMTSQTPEIKTIPMTSWKVMNYVLQQLGSLQNENGTEHFSLYYCDQQSDIDYLRGKTSSFMLYDIKRHLDDMW